MISAPGEPPGSRVSTTSMPKRAQPRPPGCDAWVDLPVPSPPSKVMKRPRIGPPSLSRRMFGQLAAGVRDRRLISVCG